MKRQSGSGRYTPRSPNRTKTVDAVGELAQVDTEEGSLVIPDMKKLMLAIGRGQTDGEAMDVEQRRLAMALWAEAMEPGFSEHATTEDLDFLIEAMERFTNDVDSGIDIEAQFTSMMERDGRFRGLGY